MEPRSKPCVGVLFGVLGASALLLALSRTAPAGEPGAAPQVEISTTEDMDTGAFLRVVAEATSRRLVWDPQSRQIQGKKMSGPLFCRGTPDHLFSWARSLLTFYELAVVEVGPREDPTWIVLDVRQSAAILHLRPIRVDITEQNADDLASEDGVFVTATLPVEHASSLRELRTAVSKLVTGMNIGSVTELPESGALVVTDFAPTVVQVWRLVREFDTRLAKRAAVQRVFPLSHADAAEVAPLLRLQLDANDPAPNVPATDAEGGPRLHVHALPRGNRILARGSPADVEAVGAAIRLLDVALPEAPAKKEEAPPSAVEVVRLEHALARDVENVVARVIAASPEAWTRDGVAAAVVADEAGHAVVLEGPAAVLTKLRRLVADLDAPSAD